MTTSYRADIDGLRAIAVLAILFYHVGVGGFSGGYVGVDIFFVISGYLITSIIVRELHAGTFTIAQFYERRARRLLPALIVVLIATLLTGMVLLTADQLEALGRSALATMVFASNVLFFAGTGYFDGAADTKPLLHTWSLAVEEQFYILFPLLLVFTHRYCHRKYLPAVAMLAVLSLLACIALTRPGSTATFFLIPFRSWELLLGALLALEVVPALPSRALRTTVATTGLLLVLGSVYSFDERTAFPGFAALIPTLGSALIIHSGSSGDSSVSRTLGVRPLVFIGLISYSLYLWHWPIVVYAKQYLINEPTELQATLIVIASLFFAIVSWRYVETPFRDRSRFTLNRRLLCTATMSSLSVLLFAGALVMSDGLASREPGGVRSTFVAEDPGWQYWKSCEELGEERNDNPDLCSIGGTSTNPSFILWGDSHALAMTSAVHLSARREQAAGLLAVRTGCPPLLAVDRLNRSSCSEFNDAIVERLSQQPDIETVVLAARWTLAATGLRYKNEEGATVTLRDTAIEGVQQEGNAAIFERGLERTLLALTKLGKKIVLVGQVPEIGYDVPSAVFSARLRRTDVTALIAPGRSEFEQRTRQVQNVLNPLRDRFGLRYIDPADRLCSGPRCQIVIDGTPLYRDDNHLSLRGCLVIADLFTPVFR